MNIYEGTYLTNTSKNKYFIIEYIVRPFDYKK